MRHPAKRTLPLASQIEYLVLAGILFVLAAGVLADGFNLAFQAEAGPVVTLLAPADGANLPRTGLVRLRVRVEGSDPFYRLSIYLKRNAEPGLEDKLVATKLGGGVVFTYALDPSSYAGGAYYWYAKATSSEGTSADSETRYFTLPSSENQTSSESTVSSENPEPDTGLVGSCDGGPGGHVSDPTGEKTFFYPNIPAYGTRDLFFNKADLHAIEKIHLQALGVPLISNGVIIHQELKKVTRLPPVMDLYKVYDLQTTFAWPEDSFYLTVFFRYPKDRLVGRGLTLHQVALHEYRDEKWAPRPTFLAGETDEHYVFQSTLLGNHPFAIGACPRTYDGYSNAGNTESGVSG